VLCCVCGVKSISLSVEVVRCAWRSGVSTACRRLASPEPSLLRHEARRFDIRVLGVDKHTQRQSLEAALLVFDPPILDRLMLTSTTD
jgi:hypothetical protein